MGVGEGAEIEDEFGVARDVEIGIDTVGGGLIELGGAVDVEVVVSLGGRGKPGGCVSGGDEIAGFVVGEQDVAVGFGEVASDGAVFGKMKGGAIDRSFEAEVVQDFECDSGTAEIGTAIVEMMLASVEAEVEPFGVVAVGFEVLSTGI